MMLNLGGLGVNVNEFTIVKIYGINSTKVLLLTYSELFFYFLAELFHQDFCYADFIIFKITGISIE